MKRLFFILSLVCLAISGWAGQISREQALRQAQTFLQKKGIPRTLIVADTPLSRRRAQGAIQDYYVFNAGQNEGFVIISGDDRTVPVLGYAEHGSFDIDNLPPALADLLDNYAHQIEAIRNGAPVQARRAAHLQVPEFMTVKWNQYEPYYNKTPLGYYTNRIEGEHCVTGCVATAMAQVLYHQHFVNATQATIPGYKNYYYWKSPTGEKYAYLEEVPAGTTLDWGNMVDSYSGSESDAQKEAVANLMLYCGTSVNMKYHLSASTASVSSVPEALKTYFGYSSSTRYVTRSKYSDDEWDNLIYKEIQSLRPVIYGGQTSGGAGHAFILHGYDGDGKYAINWGWGGLSDGFFTLDALTPKNQGAGGSNGGYNNGQEAVINLMREDGSFSETVALTTLFFEVADTEKTYERPSGYINFGPITFNAKFVSDLANTYTIDVNFAVYKDGQVVDYLYGNDGQSFSGFSNTTWFPADGTLKLYLPNGGGPSFREPGTYKIVPVSRETGTTVWHQNVGSDKYFVTGVVSKDMKLKLYNSDPNGTPDPGPEVTEADRTVLAASYSELQSYTEKKQAEVTANETTIAALSAAIVDMKTTASAIEEAISAINAKLTNDTYLSESQKNEFLTQLASLSEQLSQQNNELAKVIAELNSIESDNIAVKTQIADLLSQIASQSAIIASITTKEDYIASQALADQLTTTANGIDVASLATRISVVENYLKDLSFTNVQSGLSDLGQTVDQSIADAVAAAEAAEQAEKEKAEAEELAKAQETYKSVAEKLDEVIKTHQEIYVILEDAHADFVAKMKEIEVVLAALKQQYADIEKMLEELIAKQPSTRADEDPIEMLQERLKQLADNIATLESQYQQVSDMIAQLEDQLKQYATLIETASATRDQLQNDLTSAVTAADVDLLTVSASNLANQLATDGKSNYEQFVESYDTVLENLNTYIGNINTVYTQANNLETDVAYETTSIQRVAIDESEVLGRYDLKGNRVDSTYKGMQIIRLKNGKTIKINVK